jgi:hypothetical protein
MPNSDFRSVSWYFIPWYFIVYLPVATYDASDFVNGCNCGPCQFSLDKICDAKDSCLTSLLIAVSLFNNRAIIKVGDKIICISLYCLLRQNSASFLLVVNATISR